MLTETASLLRRPTNAASETAKASTATPIPWPLIRTMPDSSRMNWPGPQ
jgi:hypothetical protein